MDIKESLQQFGLKLSESNLYLAGLKLGAVSVNALAKEAEVKRTTAYASLEKLKKLKLASESKKGRSTVYEMSSPESLRDALKIQREKLIEQEILLTDLIPNINDFLKSETKVENIKKCDRIEEIKQILFNLFLSKEKLLIMGSDKYLSEYLDKMKFLDKFLNQRITKNNNIYIVTDAKDIMTDKYPADQSSPHYKFTPNAIDFKSLILISGNRFLQIHFNSKITALYIEDKNFIGAMRYFFQFLWNSLK
ncbi:MAG: helix-turn-helix domain-containing protein [Patescibacteria group bacterium]|nr:helix-turn-helix domain-containing protein [Patescibacteria group bacterium]